jgi:hypothetical protein
MQGAKLKPVLQLLLLSIAKVPRLVPNASPVHKLACADQKPTPIRYAMPSHVNAMCRLIPVLSFMPDFQFHSKRCLLAQVHGDGFFRDDTLSDENIDQPL